MGGSSPDSFPTKDNRLGSAFRTSFQNILLNSLLLLGLPAPLSHPCSRVVWKLSKVEQEETRLQWDFFTADFIAIVWEHIPQRAWCPPLRLLSSLGLVINQNPQAWKRRGRGSSVLQAGCVYRASGWTSGPADLLWIPETQQPLSSLPCKVWLASLQGGVSSITQRVLGDWEEASPLSSSHIFVRAFFFLMWLYLLRKSSNRWIHSYLLWTTANSQVPPWHGSYRN